MKFAITFLLVVILAVPSIAQNDKKIPPKANKPDFSGKWELDFKKSEFMKGMSGDKIADTIARKEGTKKENVSYSTLFIEHHDPELKVIEKSGFGDRATEEIYYSDGRGESNTTTIKGSSSSTTKWDGKRLVTTVFRKSDAGKKSDTIIARLTLELSKDNNTLTIIRTPIDPRGGPQSMARFEYLISTSKMVYQRVQD